jgi:hypothetical protein
VRGPSLFSSRGKRGGGLIGVKALDFKDFCIVADMMKDKKHLMKKGLDLIQKIRNGMNRGR